MSNLLPFVVLIQAVAVVLCQSSLSIDNESLDKDDSRGSNRASSFVPERRDLHDKKVESVPTLGKRNDFFFAKNLKSVPRIGRRNDFFMKTATKSVPRIGRRDLAPAWMDMESVAAWPWLRDDFSHYRKRNVDREYDFSKHMDFNRELMEPRLQAVAQDY